MSYNVGGFDLTNQKQKEQFLPTAGVTKTNPNPIGAGFRLAGAGLLPRFFDQLEFGDSLEKGRENNIKTGLAALAPGGMVSRNRALRGRLRAGATDKAATVAAGLRATGAGIGAGQGAMVAAQNEANRSANDAELMDASPQGIAQAQAARAGMYQQGQQIPTLEDMLAMFAPIEQRNAANAAANASKGIGGLMQAAGGIASMFPGGQGAGAGLKMGGAAASGGGGAYPAYNGGVQYQPPTLGGQAPPLDFGNPSTWNVRY